MDSEEFQIKLRCLEIKIDSCFSAPLNEANTTAAVVTEPIPEGLNKPPEENVEDEMVTDQEMVTDEEKSPDTSGPSDAKRPRLNEDTKERYVLLN